MCGEVKSKEKDKTASTPLVTVSDLQKLKLFEAIIIRLRKNPFKTKLEPDFKMDWGIKRDEAPYPTREIKKIELFDLKKYVTEEKRKQMMSNLENSGGNTNPFSSNFGNPFTAGGMVNPFATPNMSSNMASPSNGSLASHPFSNNDMFNKPMSSLSDMDIDQMMKDIDRRLKELDEEEARQKLEMEKASSPTSPLQQMPEKAKAEVPVETLEPTDNIYKPKIEEIPKESRQEVGKSASVITANKENKPKINVDADSIIVNDNGITDDEFFDDFFGE